MSLNIMAARMTYNGGNKLQRLNKQKLHSLELALQNDYQSRLIETENHESWRCLMNHSDIKSDYDKKVISIPFSAGLEPGDVYHCLDDDTYWMIYLPYITETAYLRSQVVRCRYILEVDGINYHIFFQGPTETDLRWYIKSGINTNELNLSGTIYIKNNESTKNFFKRFTHIKIDGHVWEVQVTDSITVPGVLELEVQEYYDNTPAELPEVKKECCKSQIIGREEVLQDSTNGYMVESRYFNLYKNKDYVWSVADNPRVKIKEVYEDGRMCEVKVEQGAIGDFIVKYGDYHGGLGLTVHINTDDPIIHGDSIIYPYSTHEYFVKENNQEGIFWIESNLAKIIEQGNNKCKVEVLSGKKGNFTLYYKNQNLESNLPIEIRSF